MHSTIILSLFAFASVVLAAPTSSAAFDPADIPFGPTNIQPAGTPTGPVVFPNPTAASPLVSAVSSSVPAVPGPTSGPQAPRNVAYFAYGYEGQWDNGYKYMQNQTNAPIDLLPSTLNSGLDTLIVFASDAVPSAPTHPTIQGYLPNSTYFYPLWPQFRALQAEGVKVLLSFGGSGGDTFYLLNKSFETYYPPILNLLRELQFDGIDLDIEPSFYPKNSDYVPRSIDTPLRFIQSLKQDMGEDFIITMAPVALDLSYDGPGYSGFSYYQLDQAAVTNTSNGPVKSINWFNAQFYNGWGSAASPSDYESIIGAGLFTPDRVVMLALTNATLGGEFVHITALENTARSLKQRYPNFGGVGGYEYARAGQSDGFKFQWQWFQAIGNALGLRGF